MKQAEKLSFMKNYEEAKNMVEKKDLIKFISAISIAELLAQGNREMLAKVTFLKVKGFFRFHKHKKALECIPKALEYNTGDEILMLKNYEGVIYGYLDELKRSEKIFKELIEQIQETEFLVEVYLNLIWLYLIKPGEYNIKGAGKYLQLTNKYFESLPNRLKWKVLNNYSVYFYHLKEFDKTIEFLEDSIKYCEEKNQSVVYNNLAELYLKLNTPELSIKAEEYLKKAEIIGTKHNNVISLGYTFYFKAELDLREDQLFRALDTLSLSFEYFKEAQAKALILKSVLKINDLMDKYKLYLQKI